MPKCNGVGGCVGCPHGSVTEDSKIRTPIGRNPPPMVGAGDENCSGRRMRNHCPLNTKMKNPRGQSKHESENGQLNSCVAAVIV